MSEALIDFNPEHASSDCHFCGATPHARRNKPGFTGCKFCAPNTFSDQHATMTSFGMAKLTAEMDRLAAERKKKNERT